MSLILAVSARFGGGKSSTFFDRQYTTVAKGIAILLIMVCHSSGHWAGGRVLTPLGGIGVSIFLITSGFGLNESFKKSGLSAFWRKRLVRVYLPYFLVAIVYAVVSRWDAIKCLLNFSCIHSPYWFVSYILACYVVFWILCLVCPKHKSLVMLVLSVFALLLLPNLQAEQSFGFVTGMVLSDKKDKFLEFAKRNKSYALLVAMLMIIGVISLAIKQLPVVRTTAPDWLMNVIQCFIKYPLGFGILLSLKWVPKLLANPFLYLSGVISYELYLVHFPFYGYVQNRLWPALLLIAVSYVISYYFNKINDKMHRSIIHLG